MTSTGTHACNRKINNFPQALSPRGTSFLLTSTRSRSGLRHYATSRKVAGSIPGEVIGFFNWPNPSSRTVAMGSTQPLTVMSTRNLLGEKGQPESKIYNLTAICEPTVYNMLEPRRLTNLWDSTAYYRDSFTFIFTGITFLCHQMQWLMMLMIDLTIKLHAINIRDDKESCSQRSEKSEAPVTGTWRLVYVQW
jgi:hypothetical protein